MWLTHTGGSQFVQQSSDSCTELVRPAHTITGVNFHHQYCAGEKRLKNLRSAYRTNGLVPRVHGNKRRLPMNTLTYQDNRDIVVGIITFQFESCL